MILVMCFIAILYFNKKRAIWFSNVLNQGAVTCGELGTVVSTHTAYIPLNECIYLGNWHTIDYVYPYLSTPAISINYSNYHRATTS